MDSVQAALDQVQDILRLCQTEELGLRYLAPLLIIQLDHDQECYDMIKFWRKERSQIGHSIWPETVTKSFMKVRDADPLEDVGYLLQQSAGVQHITAMIFLKMKLLVDIINLKCTRKVLLHQSLLPELWRSIDQYVVISPISRRWLGKSYGESDNAVQKRLERQIKTLFTSAQAVSDFPRGLTHPSTGVLDADEHTFHWSEHSGGMTPATQMIWFQPYGVWPLMKAATELYDLDSEWQNENYSDIFGSIPEIRGVKTAPMAALERHRKIPEYLEGAVEDAFSLSLVKPSKIRRDRKKGRGQTAKTEPQKSESSAKKTTTAWERAFENL